MEKVIKLELVNFGKATLSLIWEQTKDGITEIILEQYKLKLKKVLKQIFL